MSWSFTPVVHTLSSCGGKLTCVYPPGESEGFNIPEVRNCPELGQYLEMSPSELAAQVPRDMRGVAKRLFCDAYMYLYQSSSMCLYR